MADYITTYGGDGYFELGSITIDTNTIFKFKATPRTAPEGFWFGNWGSYANSYGVYHPVQSNIGNQLKWYNLGAEGIFYQGSSVSDILDHSFEIEMDTTYVKVNGTTVTRNAPINKTYTSFHIGNASSPSSYDGKKPVEWEYFQIYQNGVLVLDLVPAFNNNQYCFKDKVTGNYIYGTGTISGDVTSFSIDIDNITAEYSGTSTSVTVTADEELSWTATTNNSWISLTNPSGIGDGGFTVAVAENNNYSNRTGTVIVTSSGGDVLTITVEQEKKPLIVYDHPIYRSDSLVKKMYRSGELIYLRLNPPSEEPEPPTPVLPSNTFLINYNAKFYNSSTYTIPKTEGQLFNEDMVLNAAASSFTSDHITVNGQQFNYVFQSNSLNPFNRSNTDSLTVIIKAKPSSLTSGAHSLFSNRGGSYNWMVFNPANGSPAGMFFLHTSDGNYNNVPSVQARNLNEPNIFAFRVSNGTGYGHSYTDNETFSTKNISWGGITNSVHFLGGSSSSEYWDGDFYWMYISTEALTDDEIQQVIYYNENINPTNE